MTEQQRGSTTCLSFPPSLSTSMKFFRCSAAVLTDLEAVHDLSLPSFQPPIVFLIKDGLKNSPCDKLLGSIPAPCCGRQQQAPDSLAHGDTWALAGASQGKRAGRRKVAQGRTGKVG